MENLARARMVREAVYVHPNGQVVPPQFLAQTTARNTSPADMRRLDLVTHSQILYTLDAPWTHGRNSKNETTLCNTETEYRNNEVDQAQAKIRVACAKMA